MAALKKASAGRRGEGGGEVVVINMSIIHPFEPNLELNTVFKDGYGELDNFRGIMYQPLITLV